MAFGVYIPIKTIGYNKQFVRNLASMFYTADSSTISNFVVGTISTHTPGYLHLTKKADAKGLLPRVRLLLDVFDGANIVVIFRMYRGMTPYSVPHTDKFISMQGVIGSSVIYSSLTGNKTGLHIEKLTVSQPLQSNKLSIGAYQVTSTNSNVTLEMYLSNVYVFDLDELGDLPRSLKEYFMPSSINTWEELLSQNMIQAVDGVSLEGWKWFIRLFGDVKTSTVVEF